MATVGQLDDVAPVTTVLPELGEWERLEVQWVMRSNDPHHLAAVDNP